MITRFRLRKAILRSRADVMKDKTQQSIMKCILQTFRQKGGFRIHHEHALRILHIDRICFIESTEGHWAETDGDFIWLNRCKSFSDEDMYFTLLHESLHGIVRHHQKELSEYREHEFMKNLDSRLI